MARKPAERRPAAGPRRDAPAPSWELACTREADLSADLGREILLLQQAAFPHTEDFRRQRWHHTPPAGEDLWFTARSPRGLLAGVRVVHRRIGTAAGPRDVAGVANVCSHPQARGLGAAKACLLAAQEHIARDCDFGMLFCRQPVREYYEALGWRVADNAVPQAGVLPASERRDTDGRGKRHVMVFPGQRPLDAWPPGAIDLNGPDW